MPTDADMNKIINFLSSTQLTGVQQKTEPARPTSSLSANSKLPLGGQRSSPLPGAASRFLEKEIVNSYGTFGRHNSDWQLYKPAHTPAYNNSSGNAVSFMPMNEEALCMIVYRAQSILASAIQYATTTHLIVVIS